MKVVFTKEQKRYITVAQLPAVKRMIADLKSEYDMNDFAPMAVRIASGTNGGKIFEASAEIAKNCRIYNMYFEGSEDLDVWLTIYALTDNGFYEIGAYLSDVWQLNGENADELREHMYICKYTEIKD